MYLPYLVVLPRLGVNLFPELNYNLKHLKLLNMFFLGIVGVIYFPNYKLSIVSSIHSKLLMQRNRLPCYL